ncbi:MAG: NADH-quinone oxidoreductase subunit J [Burkholderiales bacterium]|nr:NADH-quinone oxidoreductase subunit J [Anaerolineae bacterium]
MVLTDERQFDETSRVIALPLVEDTLAPFGSPKSIGQLMLTKYLLPFEMVSLLLLVAMVGAVVLTQRYHDLSKAQRRVKGPANRRRVARPLTSVVASQLGTQFPPTTTNGDTAPESSPELQPERPSGD